MVSTPRSSRMLAILVLLGGLTGCASPPKPAVCATIGVVLGGGGGAMARQNHHDGDQAMAGAAGAALLGSAGYFLCRALAADEPEAAPPPAPVAPRSAAPAPAPPPAPPAVAERIVLRGVNFDFDKAEIRPDAAVILDEAARLLGNRAGVKVRVAGHTDWTGPDAYNQGLSERRAASVKRYLAGLGIDAGRMQTMGYGESQPIASNETREGRALNRRVELNVLE